jgi:hypothetical protein
MKNPLSSNKKTTQTTLFSQPELTEKQKELQILMFENKSALKKHKQKKFYEQKRKK